MKIILTTNFYYIVILLFTFLHPLISASRLPSSLSLLSSSLSLKSFNVRSFGAKSDGKTDNTQAFLDAWSTACALTVPSRIYVPKGTYILKFLIFKGNCKSSILFQIDGTLCVPSNYFGNSMVQSWIVFHQVNDLHIKGGILDAKGKSLWDCKLASHGSCPDGLTSLSFDNSKNIIVDGLKSIDSQKFHITINACNSINMGGLTITAEDTSPNTDGIHIEKSTGITITNSQIRTGDDCISLGPFNQNVWIENVKCGPGHGISIGSLGREKDEGVLVQNVTVKSVIFSGTDNGLRIKTFSTLVKGEVKDIYYTGVSMNNVRNPIIIDQNYCPHNKCPTAQGSGIQISNVVYKSVHGTSSNPETITFDCSHKRPCHGLILEDINLSSQSDVAKCDHKNAYGRIIGHVQPPNCLDH